MTTSIVVAVFFLIAAIANHRAMHIEHLIRMSVLNGQTVKATLLRERKRALIWNVFISLDD